MQGLRYRQHLDLLSYKKNPLMLLDHLVQSISNEALENQIDETSLDNLLRNQSNEYYCLTDENI